MRRSYLWGVGAALALFLTLVVGAAPVAPAGPAGSVAEFDDVEWLLEAVPARATAGTFQATFLEDRDGVSILEVEGDYDREVDGAFNFEPRAAVGQAFYGDHEDDVDFLVVYTTFDFDTGPSTAFHVGVGNDIEGIGVPLFDNSDLLGSAGRLQSYVDMAALGRYGTDPLSSAFDSALSTLAHEVMHRWCCQVEVRQPGGGVGDDLLGEGGSHWSYLLDSDASLMYGADWRPNGGGTFTAAAIGKFYSPLDLYLAGFLDPDEVPPFTLLENADIDPRQLPELGATVTAQERTVTVEDVVAAEGPRVPGGVSSQASSQAPSQLRFAFLILTRPGVPVTEADLAGVDRLRRAFATRFAALTGGRGIAHVLPEVPGEGSPGSATPVEGGAPRPPAQSSVADGLGWLRSVQGAEGFWQDTPSTRVRDSTAALATLAALDPDFPGQAQALSWLAAQEPLATDALARALRSLAELAPSSLGSVPASTVRGELLERQNGDGGWGADAGMASSPLDTALALAGLAAAGDLPAGTLSDGVDYLVARQGNDGSWGPAPGAAGRASVTALIVRTLQGAVLQPAVAWLAGRQSPQDGGFGDGSLEGEPSTAHDTALVLLALAELDALDLVDAVAAENFLRSRQTQEGSWDGSVFTTATAITALQQLELPNLAVTPTVLGQYILVQPAEPRDGERVRLTATVVNAGGSVAAASLLRFYDGDPAAGGTPLGVESPLPALAPGEQVSAGGLWETTDAAGEHRIFALVDPDGAILEAREDDNRAAVDVTVAPPPAGVDVELRGEDIAVSPASPDSLPVQLAITATVRNFGLTDATDVQVDLWRGTPEAGEMVGTVVLPLLAGRSSLPANFTDLLTAPGTTTYTVVASTVPADEDPTNNRASVEITTQATTDLEVLAADLALSRDPAFLGTDVTVTATLRNRGTLLAPTFTARYSVMDDTETVVIRELTASIPAGESLVQSFPWRVDRVGSLTLVVELDPEQRILEGDEGNNRAELPFIASAVTEPNLTLALTDLVVTPEPALEGSAAALEILLRNTGGTDLSGAQVAFYDGDPTSGGSLVGEVVVDSLAAGEDRAVTVPWPTVPDASDRLIFVVADPANAIPEIDEEDNQVFRRLTVLNLPDVALGSASLSFQPPVPIPGQNVELTVAVANLGEQGTGPFVVRAYAGDPAAGLQLGSDAVLDLPGLSGGAAGMATFSFVPTAGTQVVTVVADGDDAVAESEEGNNRAEQELASQDPDFAASPRYFSPDGDGVQDTTLFTYRLGPPQAVDMRVVDARGRELRRETGGPAAANGSFQWDGRDDLGRLVLDGELRFEVVASDSAGPEEEVLGAAPIVLDVNRSPLEEAFGTELEQFTNLSCLLRDVDADLAEGTDSVADAVYLGAEGSTAELSEGLYRVPLTRPVPETLAAEVSVSRVVVAPDGSRVAWQQTELPTEVWSADANGGGAVLLTTGALSGISADGDEVVFALGNPASMRSVPSDGSGPSREIFTLGGPFSEAVASKDHRYLALLEGVGPFSSSGYDQVKVWLLDLVEESGQLLSDAISLDVLPAFSPDGSRLAVADSDGGRVRVFETSNAQLAGEFQLPVGEVPRQLLTAEQDELAPNPWAPAFVGMASLDWSPQGDSLLVVGRFGTLNCEGTWRLFRSSAPSWVAEGSAWIETFLTADPDTDCSEDDGLPPPPSPPGPVDPLAFGATAFAEGQVLVPTFGAARFLNSADRILVGPWVLTEEGEVARPFEDFEDVQPETLVANGRGLLFRSTDLAREPSSPCYRRGSRDLWSFFSRLNLTAELQPRRTADGTAILLEGTAADVNFASYRLEWSPVEAPDQWSPVAPPSSRIVLDGRLGTWIPPQPGAYFVRLTVVDRAGNRRSVVRQVVTVNAPAVANLVAAPDVFSAQPGAALTHTELSYDVLRPVNLAVLVFDGEGQRVRAFQRSHPQVSAGETLLWDGRDDFGVPVADGEYRIQVQGYEAFVEVDSTPPEVSTEIQRVRFGGQAFLCQEDLRASRAGLKYFLSSTVSGAAEGGYVLEVGEGLAPSTWRTLATSGLSVELEIPEVVGRRYRSRAEDEVGNGTVRLADLPVEAVTLVSLGGDVLTGAPAGAPVENLLPVYYPDPLDLPDDLPPVESAPVLNLVPDGPLRVALRESLRAPLASLFLQYQLPGEPGLWREVAAESYFVPGSTAGTSTPPDHELEARFATGLPSGVPLALRLRAVDAGGGQQVSNLGNLFLWSLTYRGRLRPGDLDDGAPFAEGLGELLAQADLHPAEDAVFWGTQRLEDPAVGVYLRVRSDTDPDYEEWRRVEPAAASAELFIVALPDLDPEAEFQVRVGRETPSFCATYHDQNFETEHCSGQRPEGCSPTGPDPVRRLELTALKGFTEEATCGITAHDGLRLSLRPIVQGDLRAERLQVFAGDTPVVGEPPVFEVVDPVHQRLYVFDELLPLPLAQERAYRAVLSADDGQRVEKVVRFPAGGAPPVPVVDSPADGQKVCAVEGTHFCGSIGAGGFFLPVFGQVEDDLGAASHRLSLLVQEDGEVVELPFADLKGDQECYASLGQLGVFGDHAGEALPAGPMSLRLVAEDAGGNVACQEVPFVLDSSVEPVVLGVGSDLFSPNGDGILDAVALAYTSQEATQLTVEIFPAVAPGHPATEPVRTVVADLGVVGSGEVAWNGRDDSGLVVPDGRYLAVVVFVDDCGNRLERQQWVEVDTTPPAVAVTSPVPGEPVGLVVEVIGAADDRNFQRYDVAWGSATGGAVPEVFVRIGGGTAAVPGGAAGSAAGGTLAVWDTAGLVGEVVLRLLATDLVGNASEILVPLTLPERLGVLGGAEAVPSLFSPNGDGTLDATSLRFALLQPATVDLQVVDEAGGTVRTLLEGRSLGAGSRVEAWDGGADGGLVSPDGRYQIVIRASSASGELEEATFPAVVDTEAPALEIQSPVAGGFLRAAGEVVGSVGDAHLEQWHLEISSAGLGSWQPLMEGRSTVAGAVLGNLGGLEEGAYDLRLRATDRAGNGAMVTTSFTVDDTPPVVNLVAPVAGSFVSGLAGPVPILGTLEEANLAFYRVEIGAGVAPSTFTTVVESTTLPASETLALWDASVLPDGLVTLRLVAEDLAGGRGQDQVVVTVDHTLPQVVLTMPSEGAYVTGPSEVTGTAADANLSRYTLDLAPAGTSQFSPLATGETSVTGGVLATWAALPPDGEVLLQLTAEDEAGNRATALVTAIVDTVPPAPPTGLRASLAAAEDIDLVWNANTESDLAGYRPYRDGVLLTPVLLPAGQVPNPAYLDLGAGSGTFVYTVTAEDRAGNESLPSLPAEISLDGTPPTALLSRPSEGERVSGLVDVVGTAYSADDFHEYRLSVSDGAGGFTLLRRSGVPVQGDVLGQWSTLGRAEGSVATLRLEAEDLSGNVAMVQVTVVVDNAPPAAPQNLTAVVEGGDDVRLAWDAGPEEDLAGYFLYRDGSLATPSLVPPSGGPRESFLDVDLADGTFRYTVVAVDLAGNSSLPSAPATATVETGPPSAVLVEPAEGTEFDEPLYLLAVSEDRDVAEVLFQLRAVADAGWTDLSADGDEPFDATWDPSAESRPYGEYLLRAVATDGGGRTDPAPQERRVVFTDRTAPSPVPDLEVERVDGGDVVLRWTSEVATGTGGSGTVGSGDVAGYRLRRAPDEEGATPVWVHAGTVPGPTYVDTAVADGRWRYTIVAVDTAGNASTPSSPALARVFTPELVPPTSPTPGAEVRLEGSGVDAGMTLDGEVRGSTTTVALPSVIAGAEGRFVFEDVPLERGGNVLAVTASDGAGNRSKEATASVTSAPPPASPLWQSAEVTGQVVDLAWLANTEPDLQGYLVLRDGAPLQDGDLLTETTFSESLPDGSYVYTLQAVNSSGFASPLSEPRTVTVGDGVAPEAVVLSGAARDSFVDLTWTASEAPDVARYDLYRDGVEILRHGDLGDLSTTDGPLANGTYIYQIAVVDVGGNRSDFSNAVAVTVEIDVLPAPTLDAVTAGPASLTVSWSTAPGSSPAAYQLLRSATAGGPYIAVVTSSELSFEDTGLTVGQEYFYVVTSLDPLGNASAHSNEGSGTPVALDPLEAPRWTAPTVPGTPLLTSAARLDLAGTAVEGSLVTVLRDGIVVGEAPARDPAFQVVPSLTVTGRLEPSPNGSLLAIQESALYSSSVFDLATGVEAEIPDLTGPPRWVSDGQRIAYPTVPFPTVYDLRDGGTEELGFVAEIRALVPGRGPGAGSERYAALASRLGGEGLWTFTGDSFLWTRQVQAPLASFDEHSLRWSPDGSRLVFKQGTLGKTWQMVDVGSGTRTTLGPQAGSSQADFAPDGSMVALTQMTTGSEQIWLVDPLTGVGSAVTSGPLEHFEPRFSPDGLQLAYLDGDGFLYLLDLAAGSTSGSTRGAGRVFEPALDLATVGQWKWTPAGMIFNRSGEVLVLSTESRFELPDVDLAVGDNVFTARAEVDGERQSPLSEPMVITRGVDGLPDFAVGEGSFTLLPSLPRAGEAARLTLLVENVAATAAPETDVEVVLLDATGGEVALTIPNPLSPLGPGETGSWVVDLPALGAGRHQVQIVVDPGEAIDEVSEINNRASFTFVVVAAAAPQVTVTTDQEIYLSGATVQATAVVTNGGETFSGRLEIHLQDAEGRTLRLLTSVVVPELVFGATQEVETSWETAASFAGAYRVQASLEDDTGLAVDEAVAEFEVAEDFVVRATAAGDRQVYIRGEEAVLRGVLQYETGNAVLDGVQTRLSVEDPDGAVVAQWIRDVGSLLPRGEATDQRSWTTTGAALGTYRIDFEATRLGRPLAQGEGSFEVTATGPSFPALEATKVAELAIDSNGDGRPSPGDTLLYRIQVESVGGAPALEAVLEDAIPTPSTLVAGSVTTDRGSVETEDPVRVALGDLTPGDGAEVTFQVLLPSPWPSLGPGVEPRLVNQGLLSATGISQVPTDDPSTATPADATVTPIFVAPSLVATKVDSLVEDRDGDGIPGAGDVLGYVVTISNVGSTAASSLRLTDFLPTHTTVVAGSVATAVGTVEGEDPVRVDLSSLAPGAQWAVVFQVLVDVALPLEVRQISNQASIASAELPVVLSDDPDRGGQEDPTLTSVTAQARLVAEKTAILAEDRDGDGQVSPGDSLLYRLEVGNDGSSAAAGVLLTDVPSARTTVEAGSVETTVGTVLSEDPVVVEIGLLEADASASITFLARVDDAFPTTETEVANQATVTTFDGGEPLLSDDPATTEVGDPTRVEVFVTPEVRAIDGGAVEGDLALTFVVSLDEPSNRPVTVAYGTEDGSALAGEDYVATSGTLVLDPGVTTAEVIVELLDDTLPESSETFFLRLATVDGGVLVDGEGEGTILDDDLASGLAATLVATLVEDLNGDGIVNPGETLELRGEIENSGEATLTGLSYEAPLPDWTQLIGGSVTTSVGTVVAEDPVRVEMPQLEASQVATVRYRVVVANPIPTPELEISTQGTARSDQLETVLTDDPTRPGTADPTLVEVVGESLLEATLTAELGPALPGDVLTFQAVLTNPGTAALNGTVFVMDIPEHTSLVEASVVVTQGEVVYLDPLTVEATTVWPGAPAEVRFDLQIDELVPPSVHEIVAQGWISSDELPDRPTDDPSVPGDADPTVVPLEQVVLEIPTLSGLGGLTFALLLALASVLALRRRRPVRVEP